MAGKSNRDLPKTAFVPPPLLNVSELFGSNPAAPAPAPLDTRAPGAVRSDNSELTPDDCELLEETEGFAPDRNVEQYQIIRQLGRGGMGVVYLARDTKLARLVALKFLKARHWKYKSLFKSEAEITAKCTHENIVVIHEVGEYEGDPFMVLEYIDGAPLSDSRDSWPLELTRVVEIMSAVARALARAHDEGIVHRDLKPENILLGRTGAIKVVDFGIAKVREHDPSARAASTDSHRTRMTSDICGISPTGLLGTTTYMSPEQWQVGGDIDHRTDIWAFGLTLYELLSGVHPFAGTGVELRDWVSRLDVPVPSLATVAPDVPKELIDLVDACLRKRREDRIQSARDLLRLLEPFQPGRYKAAQAHIEAPYAGLRAFQEEDAGRFFGRTTELAEITTRLRETPMIAVIGPSGVGKSSLLRAGVVPAMRNSGDDLVVLTLRPGRYPLTVLAGLCVPFVDPSTIAAMPGGLDNALRARLASEPGYMGLLLREYCHRHNKRVFLLIDQFEELYTLGANHPERQAFTACLSGTADDSASRIRVVITIRADFFGRVAEDSAFMNQLNQGLFFLGPPSKDGLRDALTRPAENAGYRFENTAMVNEMIHFLESSPSGLPLLQFAASQLWEARDPTRHVLTEQAYRGLGGVQGALITHADQVVSRFTSDQQMLCRAIFLHLVTAERTRAVRSVRELGELLGGSEVVKPLVDELVNSRLLVAQSQSATNTASVEIVHESLILSWPTLRRWLDASHEDSQFLDQLMTAARQWDAKKRAAGLLWSGETVDELDRFLRRYKGQLPKLAGEFVAAIRKQDSRRANFRRGILLSVGVFVTVVIVALLTMFLRTREAQKQAEASAIAAKQRLAEKERAENEAKKARGNEELSKEELKAKNQQLEIALKREKEQRAIAELAKEQKERANEEIVRAKERAEHATKIAEDNEKAANDAKASAQEAEKRERDRADDYAKRLGLPIKGDLP